MIGGSVAALVLLVAVATMLLLATAPGHALVRRLAVRALQGMVTGRVEIGSVGGSLWQGVELRDVTFATNDGQPVIRAQSVSARFALLDLLRARYRFTDVLVVRPVVVLDRGLDGKWNVERMFAPRAPTGQPGRPPLVELRGVRIVDGTVSSREHKSKDSVIARAILGLNAGLSRLRLSHPDSAAIEAQISSLAGRVRNPDLVVTHGEGSASLAGDSLRFAFSSLALPATAASASGVVGLSGPVSLDAAVNARRLAFDDVRSLIPMPLPGPGGGAIDVRLHLGADGSNEFDIRAADIHTGRSAVSGRVRLTIGAHGGASVRGMDLDLRPLDLALLRLYTDTVPVRGLVRGRVRGEGSLRDLMVVADVAWADESVDGAPVNTVAASGHLALGGAQEVAFRAFTVNRSDIDLRTIGKFAPPVDLPGRLHAAGTLDGPWKDATFRGALVHVDADGLASHSRGIVRLGMRDTLRIDADLDFDSLSLDLLRRRYPAIPLTGALAGRVTVHGPITAMAIDAALRGGSVAFTAKGTVGASRDSIIAVAMTGTFDSLDLRYAAGSRMPPSVLAGRWEVDLLVPSADVAATTGTASIGLDSGTVSGVTVAGGAALLRLERVRVALDSARLDFEGGTVRASGGIGRGAGLPARLDFSVRADTAQYLEPLVRWARREGGDSSSVRLDGPVALAGHVEGTTLDWRLEFEGTARGVQYGTNNGRGLSANGRLECGPHGCALSASGAADTIAAAGLLYAPVGLSARGPLDSLTLSGTAGFHVSSALRATLTVSGDSARRSVRLDSLDLDLPVRSWHLVRTARFTFTSATASVDTLELRPRVGAGLLRAAGALPRAGAVAMDLLADSVPIADIYAVLQPDTARISGVMNGSLHVTGTAGAPVIDLLAALADGRFGDYRLPLVRLTAHYVDHRLALEGGVWRDSLRLLALTGSLPLDLALESVNKRQLEGPLSIVASADSLDMAVLNPLTVLVRDLAGVMSLDVRIGGTWSQPSLSGAVDIWDGVMRVPALGARYDAIDARLSLANDVMQVTRASISGAGGGQLDMSGQVRFEELTKPVLDLTLRASQFAAFDIKGFGSLTATGQLSLKGPAIGATLSGRIEVEAGSLQFRDLVEKRIVSLDDPEFRELVDTNLARAAELGPAVRTLFIDSLRVEGLTVALGSDVWLRSSESNIQLDGEFDVDRNFESGFERYRLDGTLHAVRGTYKLTLGKENSFLALSRDFRVTNGTVRFFGTPDFNPDLDISAEHVVRTAQGSQLTVRALITGTLRRPVLHLESDAQPPLTETEIVSYLMFGQPPASLAQSGVGGRSEAALAQAVGGSLVGGVGQALASELGLPLDYLTIVPGSGGPGGSTGVSTARVEAGAQLGERTFLTLNAGLCEVLAAQLVGATLQYRLSSRWSASATFEPVIQECGTSAGLTGLATRKQVGFDLFWQQGIR